MKLTRLKNKQTVQLEDGFLWADEYIWQPIEQKVERAIDGTLIIQEGKKKYGRPISLQPNDEGMGWLTRESLSIIQEWSFLQNEVFKLAFEYLNDKRTFFVIFNHQDGAISNISNVLDLPSGSSDANYRATFKFLEVENAD